MEYVRCYIRSEIGRDVKKENYDNLKQMGRLQWLALKIAAYSDYVKNGCASIVRDIASMACVLWPVCFKQLFAVPRLGEYGVPLPPSCFKHCYMLDHCVGAVWSILTDYRYCSAILHNIHSFVVPGIVESSVGCVVFDSQSSSLTPSNCIPIPMQHSSSPHSTITGCMQRRLGKKALLLHRLACFTPFCTGYSHGVVVKEEHGKRRRNG